MKLRCCASVSRKIHSRTVSAALENAERFGQVDDQTPDFFCTVLIAMDSSSGRIWLDFWLKLVLGTNNYFLEKLSNIQEPKYVGISEELN